MTKEDILCTECKKDQKYIKREDGKIICSHCGGKVLVREEKDKRTVYLIGVN